jgi:fatty acid desaturase
MIDFLSAVFATAGPLWRFGHDYSHHSFTNHPDLDNDVFLLSPVLRTRPEYKWRVWHALQYIVVPLGLAIHAFRFPIQNAFTLRNPYPPILHYTLMYILPCYLGYGGKTALVVAALGTMYGSMLTGWLFSVSHNFPGAVDIHAKPPKRQPDWAAAQVEHSCNWGGRVACFFTGGLNYQIEHHLFPSLDPNLYPALSEFVRKECKDAHVPYVHHPTLAHAVASTFRALWALASPSKSL